MGELRLDYQLRRPVPWGGTVLLIVAVSGLLMTGAQYRDLRDKFADWNAKLADNEYDRPRQEDSGHVTRPPADVALEVQHANEVLRKIGMPWDDLFRAVESSASKNVVLLSMEPDMEKRVMKINGEAKDIPSMLEYVTQLGGQEMFASVYLQSHQIQLQSQDRPVRFALLAVLKGQS